MARVKSSPQTRARRKKVLKQAKGYFGSKHLLFKTAKEQVMHSLNYAYRDRRTRKRDSVNYGFVALTQAAVNAIFPTVNLCTDFA